MSAKPADARRRALPCRHFLRTMAEGKNAKNKRVRPEYAKKNPETVKRVVHAMARGNRWVTEHNADEVAKLVAKFFKNSPSDVLLNTVEAIKPAVISDGRMALEGLKGVEEVYRVNGVVKKPVP